MKPKEIKKHKLRMGTLKSMSSNIRSFGKQPSRQVNRRRSIIIPLILAVILLILLTSCQKPTEMVAGTATRTLDTSQKQSSTAATSSNQNSGTSSAATTTPDLSSLISGTPLLEWNGIPLMPDALAGSERDGNYLFNTPSLPADVADFYNQEMQKLGWTARPENETPDPSGIITLAYEKDKLKSVVGIIPQAEGSVVMLSQRERP